MRDEPIEEGFTMVTHRTRSRSVSCVSTTRCATPLGASFVKVFVTPGRIVVTRMIPKTTAEMVVVK